MGAVAMVKEEGESHVRAMSWKLSFAIAGILAVSWVTPVSRATGMSAGPAGPAGAEVKVAVAANFTAPLDLIAAAFLKASGHPLAISSGSTGKLAAQIENGAPFEVLLAADAEHPALLEKRGSAVAGTRFTYARGRLALWSADPALVDAEGKVLSSGRFRHLALANPQLAPYGAAAQQALTDLGLWQKLAPLVVQGEDIGQAYQFVATGSAELGFVALSQVRAGIAAGQPKGSLWLVPDSRYKPIEQQAVLLVKGKGDPAARALLDFLKGAETRAVLERFGYGLP
jgi:molybdate transport system substrate-binding protein